MKITIDYKNEIACAERVFDIGAIAIGMAEIAHEAVEKVAKCFIGDWARISLNMSTCELSVCCPREYPTPDNEIYLSYPVAKRDLVIGIAGLIIIEMMEHGIASEFFGIKHRPIKQIVSAIHQAVARPDDAPNDDLAMCVTLLVERTHKILISYDQPEDIPY